MSSTTEGHSFLVSGKCDAKKTPLTRFRGRLAIAEMGGEGSDMAIEVNCCIFIIYFQRVAYYCRCFHFIVRDVFVSSVAHGMCRKRRPKNEDRRSKTLWSKTKTHWSKTKTLWSKTKTLWSKTKTHWSKTKTHWSHCCSA